MRPQVIGSGKSGDDEGNAGDSSAPPPSSSTMATGLSHFLAKVLDQLSLSSWLPAVVLVANSALLLQLQSIGAIKIAGAISSLVAQQWGIVIVLLFAVIIATVVTQAFEFEAIRLLEGYISVQWSPIRHVVELRVRRWRKKQARLEAELLRAELFAFRSSVAGIRRRFPFMKGTHVKVIDRTLRGKAIPAGIDNSIADTALEFEWRQQIPPECTYRILSLEAALAAFPRAHRILPTRLGNVIRSAEDTLIVSDNESLEGFVIRYFDLLPVAIREEHEDHRTRLDMYCTLVLVFVSLTILASCTLLHLPGYNWTAACIIGAYALMAIVSYEAAIASGRGYGDALREIDRFVRLRQDSARLTHHTRRGVWLETYRLRLARVMALPWTGQRAGRP